MFYNGLGRFLAQGGGPGRPKIAPRRVQDRLGSGFLTLDFSPRFLIVLGSILVPFWPPKWCPWGGPLGADPRRSQDRLGSVLFSSCRSGSLFWSSWAPLGVVFGRLGLLLGSFLAAPGVVLVPFRHFNSSIQPVNSSTRRFNSSTHQPMALRHFLTRPGGLRAARLNNVVSPCVAAFVIPVLSSLVSF